jgi:antitoxin component of MazEF toxin-antitoxin module
MSDRRVGVQLVKIRRVGNSNVISLPRSLEQSGYMPGTEVLVDTLPSGEVVLHLASGVREHIRAAGRRIIAENREALDILEAYDRDPAPNNRADR